MLPWVAVVAGWFYGKLSGVDGRLMVAWLCFVVLAVGLTWYWFGRGERG